MPERPTLSVVMPAYNERATIHVALERVLAAPVDSIEIVVVDDGSTDGTRELLTRGIALGGSERGRIRQSFGRLRDRDRGEHRNRGAEHPESSHELQETLR